MMLRYIGESPDGVKRVWGQDHSDEDARRQCMGQALECISFRPDLGPISGWTFTPAESFEVTPPTSRFTTGRQQ